MNSNKIYMNMVGNLFEDKKIMSENGKAAGELGVNASGSTKESYSGIIKASKAGMLNQMENVIIKANLTGDGYDLIGETDSKKVSDIALTKSAISRLENLVSAEDFSKFEKLGIIPDKDEPESIVTVSERIAIELASHGKGDFFQSISKEDIKSMYGETSRAYAVAKSIEEAAIKLQNEQLSGNNGQIDLDKKRITEKSGVNNRYTEPSASEISEFKNNIEKLGLIKNVTPEMAGYIVKNGLEINTESLYMSRFATDSGKSMNVGEVKVNGAGIYAANVSGAGLRVESIDTEDFYQDVWSSVEDIDINSVSKNIKSEVEAICHKAGIEYSDNVIKLAQYMVDERIEVTAANIDKFMKIQNIQKGKFLCAGADPYSSALEESVLAMEVFVSGDETQIKTLIADGKEVNVLNMKKIQEDNSYKFKKEIDKKDEKELRLHQIADHINPDKNLDKNADKNLGLNEQTINEKSIKAMRQLEETRALMTSRAFFVMAKSGVNISVEPMARLVERLKEMESSYIDSVFDNADREFHYTADSVEKELFVSTVEHMNILQGTPVYALGMVYNETIEYTVASVAEAGDKLGASLRHAGEAYETLGTRPRHDLGDSIGKAFGNIDEILKSIDMEDTAANERAVKILASNQIEITQAAVKEIRLLDSEVTRLVENMTPKTVAYLISNGINPLNKNISELNDMLDEIHENIIADDVEKYSEYLWKIENTTGISKEDRQAFIDIYRALNMINKKDRKAIGAMYKRSGSFTMGELVTMFRSDRKLGMDVEIDEKFGLNQSGYAKVNSFSDNQKTEDNNEKYYESTDKLLGTEFRQLKDMLDKVKSIDTDFDEISDMSVEELNEYLYSQNYINKNVIEQDNQMAKQKSKASDSISGQNQMLNSEEKEMPISVKREIPHSGEKEMTISGKNEMSGSIPEDSELLSDAEGAGIDDIRNLKLVEDSIIRQIIGDQTKLSVENLLALNTLMSQDFNVMSKAFKLVGEDEKQKLEDAVNDVYEKLDDEEGLKNAEKNLKNIFAKSLLDRKVVEKITIEESAAERTSEEIRREDIVAMKNVNRALSYIGRAAMSETYYVPLKNNGDYKLLRLTIRKSDDNKNIMEMSIKNTASGDMYGKFSVSDGKLKGYIIFSEDNRNMYQREKLTGNNSYTFEKEIFPVNIELALNSAGVPVEKIDILTGMSNGELKPEDVRYEKRYKEDKDKIKDKDKTEGIDRTEGIDKTESKNFTAMLYRAAKIIVRSISD